MTSRTLRQTAAAPAVAPPGAPVAVGPWQLTLAEAITGEEALSTLMDANAGNEEPRDGLAYLLVRIACRNESDAPLPISTADFAAAGPDGALRRAASVALPEPGLEATVEPGESTEGWVALFVPEDDADGEDVVVRYDSTVGASWAEALLAVQGEPALPAGEPADPSTAGAAPDAPAAFDETVTTGGWAVAAVETITGQEVFDRSARALQALGWSQPDAIPGWRAIRLRVTNLGATVRHFPATACHMANGDGTIVEDELQLTPPIPDVSGDYLPGATGDGWVCWGTRNVDFVLLHVDPSALGADPRFISLTGAPPAPSGGESADEDPLAVAAGDTVVVTESEVNLRAEPTTSAEIVATLNQNDELVVTGEPVTADGYRWYPVEAVATGEAGFVVQEFLAAA